MTCYCGSQKIKKAGVFKNRNGLVQRYACCECGKTFSQSNNNGMRIPKEKIHLAVQLLCESNGIRATSRIVRIHQETVLKILKISGTISANFMEEKAKNLKCTVVAADEIHSFVHAREQNIRDKSALIGTQFTFLSVDRDSRFIINTVTGERSAENADAFFVELRKRTVGRFQLNTDSWTGYRGKNNSIKRAFGEEIDHATEEKTFWKLGQFVSRTLANCTREKRIGNPKLADASTSRVERMNLNVRTFTRRFTRCTLGFSKKLSNHRIAVDLFIWYQNFARKQGTIKTTPALAIGLDVAMMKTADLWNIGISNNLA